MSTTRVNVLVTDDHMLFRRGTMKLLETFSVVDQIDEAENGQVALKILGEKHIDIVLLDLDMPVMDGWETSRKIVSKYPNTYIIMVSMHDDLKIISDLIEIGVHGYLLKNSDPAEIKTAIHSILNHQFYYNQLVSKALHRKVKEVFPIKKSSLTKREVEIVQLICEEMTMKEISEKLFLSEQTIHTHRKNLMRKIEAKNSVSIVCFALQNGIISL
ncbi:MAG: response regulator transcription factor [Cyclobacteriaceae bacterium]